MKKGKKNKLIIAALIIVLAVAAGAYAIKGSAVEVSAVPVDYGSVEKIITETGSVEARNTVTVSSKIQGQLLSVDVSEGDAVTEGQRIISYTSDSGAADIGGVRAQISGLQVQLNQANDLAAKNLKLYEEGALSYEDYNQAVTNAKQIESQIAALNYSIAGLSEAGGSKGVSAPIAGTVTSVFVSEGEIVAPGAQMIEISDASETYINVNLVSEDADETALGDQVRVFSESEKLLDENAAVTKIFVKAQDVLSDLGIYQKRVPVEITLSEDKGLRLGSNVNLEIVAEKRDNALRAPANSVFEINKQHYVYKIENGKAKLQGVEIGLEGEDYTEILGGLSEGDMVITSPSQDIEDGKAVK